MTAPKPPLALLCILFLSVSCSAQKRDCDPKLQLDGVAHIGTVVSGVSGEVCTCSPAGKWVVDKEATRKNNEYFAKAEEHRQALLWAMRSRIATTEEIEEVRQRGKYILLPVSGGTFSDVEIDHQYNDLLLHQFQMRLAAESIADLKKRIRELEEEVKKLKAGANGK